MAKGVIPMPADLPVLTYEFLVSFVPLVIVIYRYGHRQKSQGFPITRFNYCMLVVLGLYSMGVLHVTGAGTLWSGLRYGPDFSSINLIPFSHDIHVPGYLLNILMVMPLGFLVPLMFSGQNRWLKITAMGFLLSLLLEISQIFSFRATDVDDLIMNTLGALLGYALFRLVGLILKGRRPPRKLPASGLLLVPLTVLFSRFFLFDQLGFIHLYYR